MHWGKVTILGVGLLGGSIGLALKKRGLSRVVCGYVRRQASVRECLRAGVADQVTLDLSKAVDNADLVVVCTPIADIVPLTLSLRPALKRGALVTDVGSVKAPIVRKLAAPLRRAGVEFVGSHPMAGSDRAGVRFARADLFEGAMAAVTPDKRSGLPAVRRINRFWRDLGSRVVTLDAGLHDRLVSRASHLPHMLASALANQVLDPQGDVRQAELCATGFRDTTRVAGGSPQIWRDIAMSNRSNLVRDLAAFEKRLARLRNALSRGDVDAVTAFLQTAQQRRLAWAQRRPDASAESST